MIVHKRTFMPLLQLTTINVIAWSNSYTLWVHVTSLLQSESMFITLNMQASFSGCIIPMDSDNFLTVHV